MALVPAAIGLPLPALLALLLAVLALYLGAVAVYNLYFHPLAKFPGPKLAAATGWYEFYHDIVHRGMFIWKLDELHKKYGTFDWFFYSKRPTRQIGRKKEPLERRGQTEGKKKCCASIR